MALKYLQIEEDLKKMILSEEIMPGDRLPSENVLAQQYSVSRQTVRKALADLENEGYVYAVHGSGTFCSVASRLQRLPQTFTNRFIRPVM